MGVKVTDIFWTLGAFDGLLEMAQATWAPAFASHQEQERGTIEVGKRADLSVFSLDLMQAPFEQIPTAHALLAVSDGVITHNAL